MSKVTVYWGGSAWCIKNSDGTHTSADTAILKDVTFDTNGSVGCIGQAVGTLETYVPPPADALPLKFDGTSFRDKDGLTLTRADVLYLSTDRHASYINGEVAPIVCPIAEPIKAKLVELFTSITATEEATRAKDRKPPEPPKTGVLTKTQLEQVQSYLGDNYESHNRLFRILFELAGEHRLNEKANPKFEATNFPPGFCFYLTSNRNDHNYGDSLVIATTKRNEGGLRISTMTVGDSYNSGKNSWRAATPEEITAAILKLDAAGLIAMTQKLPDLVLPVLFSLTR